MTSGWITSGALTQQSAANLACLIKKLQLQDYLHTTPETGMSARGDELKEAGEYHQLAKLFESYRQNKAAAQAEARARLLVAKELNDMDGFDR